MCGIHNCTKNLTLQNLHSFTMEGAAESRENVIISMIRQVTHPVTLGTHMNEPICTSIDFFNVSSVDLTTMTMICPSISLKGGLIKVKNSNLYGHTDFNKVLSFLSITGQDSQAIFDDCVLKHNCFVINNMCAKINVNTGTFQSYRHPRQSIIMANSSVVTLKGYVSFTDSIVGFDPKDQAASSGSGTALHLQTNSQNFQISTQYIGRC